MKKQRILFIALAVLILLLCVSGSVATIYAFASPITAQVNIQPITKKVQSTSTLSVVTDHPDVAQHQIVGAHLFSATAQQTLVQTATGQGYTQATAASGEVALTFNNLVDAIGGYFPLAAGSTWKGTNGITIVADQSITVDLNKTGYFHAHVISSGSYGNMAIHGFYLKDVDPGQQWMATFTNSTAFTGGQDSQTYATVQQSDITAGEQALTPTVQQSALGALNAKVAVGEQWVQTPTCTTTPTADGTVGEAAQNFHVTVSATCSGEVYDTQVVKTAAAQNLTTLAQNEFGNAYQLFGAISTTIAGVQVIDQHQGTLAISLTSEGTWVAHFTDAQKLHLAQLIDGKSVVDAQRLLSQQTGIGHAAITLAHSFWIWNKLPTDPGKISITILH